MWEVGTAGCACVPGVELQLLEAVRGRWILYDTGWAMDLLCRHSSVCLGEFSKDSVFGQVPVSLLICCKNSKSYLLRSRLCVFSCSFQSHSSYICTMYILEALASRGLVFLTVKNVFTVNKKKIVDLHHWQRKRSFFFHSGLQTSAIPEQYLDTYLRKHFSSNLALACPKKVIM